MTSEATAPADETPPAELSADLPVYVSIGESAPQQIGTIGVVLVVGGEQATVKDGPGANGQVAELLEAAAADLRSQSAPADTASDTGEQPG